MAEWKKAILEGDNISEFNNDEGYVTGENTMGVVIHGSNASTFRPTSYTSVLWIGSVEPTNANNNDLWLDTN
jgi:hypothetical protein